MRYQQFIIFLFLFFSTKSYSYPYDTVGIYNELKSSNFSKKTEALVKLSQYFGEIKILPNAADSVANVAVLESMINNDNDWIYYTSLNYLSYATFVNISKAEKYINSILDIGDLNNNKKCNLYIQLSNLYLKYNQLEKADNSLQNAFRFINKNDINQAKYLLNLYELNFKKNEKLNAFKNLNDAIVFSKICNNDSLLFLCYKKMTIFYYTIEEWEKAKSSTRKCFDILKVSKTSFNLYDSLNLKGDLMLLYAGNNEDDMALKLLNELYPISKEYKLDYLKEYLIAILRKSFLNNNKLSELCSFYCDKYPDELMALQQNDIKTFYKVQALIFENKGQKDSAKHYWGIAEKATLETESNISIANFYKRKAQFFLRNSNIDSALNAYIHYLDFSKKANYFPFVADAAKQLDSLYAVKGDFFNAYQFSKISKEFSDSNQSLTEKDKILSLEIENIDKLNKIQAEHDAIQQSKSENFQVIIIVIFILISLATLVLISKMKLSQSFIKTFGYLTFVLFFEFIIYLLDGYIHHLTHGQPLYIMAFKVIIIGLMLPIHHATEYRVVHYLTKKNLIEKKERVGFRKQIKLIWSGIMKWIRIHDDHENTPKNTKGND